MYPKGRRATTVRMTTRRAQPGCGPQASAINGPLEVESRLLECPEHLPMQHTMTSVTAGLAEAIRRNPAPCASETVDNAEYGCVS